MNNDIGYASEYVGRLLAGCTVPAPEKDKLNGFAEPLMGLYKAAHHGGLSKAKEVWEALKRANPKLEELEPTPDPYPFESELNDLPIEVLSRLDKYPFSDAGQGEAIADLYTNRLRYASRIGWFIWDGQRWQQDEQFRATQFAKAVARVRQTAVKIRVLPDDAEERKAAQQRQLRELAWTYRAEDENKVRSALSMARSERNIAITPDDLDANDWLIGTPNGAVDLRTGELLSPDPTQLITYSTNIPYYPDAECPRWLKTLNEIFGGNADLIAFMKRWVGYCLTGSTREQRFALLYGNGANGKSTFLNMVRLISGDYATEVPFTTFEPSRQTPGNFELAGLRGKRVVVSSEGAEGAQLNEARIKAVTGNDTITASFKHQNFFTFVPKFHLMLMANHKPTIRGMDVGIWRRVLLIPFLECFFDPLRGIDRRDVGLEEYLKTHEAPGILTWAVQGAVEWYHHGLNPPDIVIAATEQYRSEMDKVGLFLGERTITKEDATVQSGVLYGDYQKWSEENGLRPVSNVKFSENLSQRGFTKSRNAKGMIWQGIGMLNVEM